ncbi:hypothetical protein Tco_1127865 [Tanacetum coccineum]
MANLSKDIQCVGSNTRPPMLDRTDFASWQQHIRLYYRGKENGVNILQSIDEGPFEMVTFRETLAEGNKDKDRYNTDIRATNILLQRLPKDIYTLINHYTDAKDIWDNVKMLLEGSELTKEDRESQLTSSNTRNKPQFKMAELWFRMFRVDRIEVRGTMQGVQVQLVMGELKTESRMQIQQPVQDLALNVDNVFQADDCDAFDFDVDEAHTAQTMFMANLSSADPVYDEASPSYDSDILSEVPDHDNYQDAVCEHHKVHEMYDDVQLNYVVDSHVDYTSDINMILYDQYVKDNAVPVVQSNVSSNNVGDKSLTTELATYKEQVELYKRRAKFELTEREQKIDEQLIIVITDRNIKEENLKRELHSKKVAIGYKNPLYLTRAKQVQLALYNGHEIIKTHHDPAIVHDSKDTLEIAEITRKQMNEKMIDPECVKKKVKIAPHDYSKENYLATFTPHKQLTPEQIFWSKDLNKMKAEALKEQTTASRPIKALTVYLQIHMQRLITPSGLTEGERGFEQTKECYLTEVIPFFKTLEDHFKGIQKALTKEIKEMKEVFEELEVEVDQNVVIRKHD